jgi:hypothetical protein
MQKWNMTYQCVVHVTIQIICSLYKFIHRTKYLYYNKMFVVGKSIVCLNLFGLWFRYFKIKSHGRKERIWFKLWLVSKNFVVFQQPMEWLTFIYWHSQIKRAMCSWLFLIHVQNLQHVQVVVDWKKKFKDIFVWMLKSMNDVHILCIKKLFMKICFELMDYNECNTKPYIINDKGYHLLPWLMIPHK